MFEFYKKYKMLSHWALAAYILSFIISSAVIYKIDCDTNKSKQTQAKTK